MEDGLILICNHSKKDCCRLIKVLLFCIPRGYNSDVLLTTTFPLHFPVK